MFQITKEESLALRAKFGNEVGITITNRGKKSGRKQYYTEETRRVTYFLEKFRNRKLRASQKGA